MSADIFITKVSVTIIINTTNYFFIISLKNIRKSKIKIKFLTVSNIITFSTYVAHYVLTIIIGLLIIHNIM